MDGNIKSGEAYSPKMIEAISNPVVDWWNNLTKEQILAFLAEQPNVTADFLRQILANAECELSFNVTFSTSSNKVNASFMPAQE